MSPINHNRVDRDTVDEKSLKFSNKDMFTLLSLLSLLNIVIRLPWTSHEVGTDTFFIHGLATSISRFGSAKWLIHPTSIFGFYPYSYPSAQPFILSGLSQSSGISIEYITLLFSIFLSLLGLCSSFILAKEIFNDDLYAILVSFLYTISPNFIELTYWQASTRSLFIAMFPLILWLYVKCEGKFRIKYVTMNLIGIIFLFTVHRVAIFSLLMTFGYFFTLVMYYLLKKRNLYLSSPVIKVHVQYILLIISSILFFSQFTSFGIFSLDHYQRGFLHSGSDFFSLLLNMIIDYLGKMGIVIPFVVIGFFKIVNVVEKRFGEYLILFNFIILLPLMGSDVYSPVPLSIFLIILSAVGVISVIRYITKKVILSYILKNLDIWSYFCKKRVNTSLKVEIYQNSLLVAVFLCLVSSVIFSLFMINHWDLNANSMNDHTLSSANFIEDKSNQTVIANTGPLASKITAYTSNPVIPLGGSYATFAPPGQITYGFVDKTDFRVTPINFSKINPDTDTLYNLISPRNANDEWVYIMINSYWNDDSVYLRSMYNNSNLVLETGNKGQYLYWSWRDSGLLSSLHKSGNKIYTNNIETIYNIPDYNS